MSKNTPNSTKLRSKIDLPVYVADKAGDLAMLARATRWGADYLNTAKYNEKVGKGLAEWLKDTTGTVKPPLGKIKKFPKFKAGLAADFALSGASSAVQQVADLYDYMKDTGATKEDFLSAIKQVFTSKKGWTNLLKAGGGSLLDAAAFIDPTGALPNGDDVRATMENAKGGTTKGGATKGSPDGRVPRNQPDPKPGGPRIVINPTTFHNKKDALCVAFNEGFRIVMDDIGFNPAAEPTPEQRDFFADTAYADDEVQLRRTILARVCTLDTSIPHPTDDQLEESVEFLGTVLDLGVCQNKWEENCVRRLMNLMAHVPQRGVGVEPPRDASALQGDVGGGATDDDENNEAGESSSGIEVEQVEGYSEPEHSADEGSSVTDEGSSVTDEGSSVTDEGSSVTDAAAAQAGADVPAKASEASTAASDAASKASAAAGGAPTSDKTTAAPAGTLNARRDDDELPINHATGRPMTKYELSSFKARQRGRAAMERGKGGIAAFDKRHAREKEAIKTMRGYEQSPTLHRIEDGLSGSPGHRLSDPITPLVIGGDSVSRGKKKPKKPWSISVSI